MGEADLPFEGGYLFPAVGGVPVEVDAAFADGYHGVSGGLVFEGGYLPAPVAVDGGGVEAQRGEEAGGVAFGRVEHALAGGGVDVGEDEAGDPGVEGPLEGVVPVGVEFFRVEVRMCVHVHGVGRFLFSGGKDNH